MFIRRWPQKRLSQKKGAKSKAKKKITSLKCLFTFEIENLEIIELFNRKSKGNKGVYNQNHVVVMQLNTNKNSNK